MVKLLTQLETFQDARDNPANGKESALTVLIWLVYVTLMVDPCKTYPVYLC